MIISYKIRIYPNKTQEHIINRTCGACRKMYNDYLGYNRQIYEEENRFVSGYEFSKKLTKWKKEEKYVWLNEISSKAIKNSIMNADTAFRRFFKGITGFPRFKSKKDLVQSYFFIGDNVRFSHNKVVLPILGITRIKENNYVPDDRRVIGGTIVKEANKYFAVFRVDMEKEEISNTYYNTNYGGYGLDIGIKNYLTISDIHYNSYYIESFLKDKKIVYYEEKINHLKRVISNKMEINYGRLLNEFMDVKHRVPEEKEKNKLKGESHSNKCRHVQDKINRYQVKITNYKNDKIRNLVSNLVKLKPEYITVESLSVKELLENDESKTLHDHIQKSKFGYFFDNLKFKCKINDIELRLADKYFASSKKCYNCGNKKKNLKLSDRVYRCDICGIEIDRDENASINLVDLKKYTVYSG